MLSRVILSLLFFRSTQTLNTACYISQLLTNIFFPHNSLHNLKQPSHDLTQATQPNSLKFPNPLTSLKYWSPYVLIHNHLVEYH